MPIVGLDLGSHNIRAVEIGKTRKSNTIFNFDALDGLRLNLESDSEGDISEYSKTLKEFFFEAGFSTSNVVVGLSETGVFMKIIEVPLITDKELGESIKYEAEQHIPIPMSQVNLSYQKIEERCQTPGKMNVQIVAARKSVVERYVKIVKGAGLIIRAIEPETLATGRLLGDTKESPTGTIILDIGCMHTFIIVAFRGNVRFTRTVPIGGELITKALQQGLGLDEIQAEEYKKVYGMNTEHFDGKVAKIIAPLIDNIIMETKKAGMFFTNSTPDANIKRVIVTGGTALMPGFILYVADKLNFEVEMASPLKSLIVSPKIKPKETSILDQASIYSTAIGLALKEI
jgi:type IV pilus assembly protein PilM